MTFDFNLPTPSTSLRERVNALSKQNKLDIIEVRVGSDSDFPKIKEILTGLQDYPLLVRIASAHRTPNAMTELAQSFPNIQVSLEDEDTDWSQVSGESREICKKLNVVTCIAAAGGSAHIAGMTASETHIPVLGYPVPSSTNGQYESDASMRDMPPGIPNGVSAYESVMVDQAKAIYDFISEESQEVYLASELKISDAAQKIINLIGLKIVDRLESIPQIGIYEHIISDSEIDFEGEKREEISQRLLEGTQSFPTPIVITNPTYDQKLDTDERSIENALREGIIGMNRRTTLGLSMSSSIDGKTNLTNSLLFAAKIIAKVDSQVRDALIEHKEELAKVVREKDMAATSQQTK